MAEPAGVFISYRRDDAAAHAGRLFDRLRDRFGEQSVFLDVDSIEPGVNFRDAIDAALSRCKALLVVIGPRWISVTGPTGWRRIDEPRDFVRLEIEMALHRGIRVIPVLVDGAAWPPADNLPATLAELADLQAVEISHAQFHSDSQRLIEGLARITGSGLYDVSARPAPHPTPWSATLIGTGWTRSFIIQLSNEKHVLDTKNGMFAYTIKLDGKVAFKRVTDDEELAVTLPISDGPVVRTLTLWLQIGGVTSVIKHSRIAVDDRLIFSD